jgi:hypothetical protein
MEQGQGGLLKFFNKLATEDDKKMTVALWREGREGTFTQGQGFRQHSDAVNNAKHEHEEDLARVRKQKERSNTRKIEIARGERSPGGTKKRMVKSARCFERTFSINLQVQSLQLQDRAPKRFKGSCCRNYPFESSSCSTSSRRPETEGEPRQKADESR